MLLSRAVLIRRYVCPLPIYQQHQRSSRRSYLTSSSQCSSSSQLQSTMLAIQVNEIGNEDKLTMNNTATPIPALSSTQCLIENHYAGLNFHDTYTRSGLYPLPLPFTVGCEGGGIVNQVGSDVKDVKVGDRVVYLQEGPNGSYALEYTRLMPVPLSISLDVATATAVQGLTAHYLINDSYNVKRDDWVIIHAAAGGTGQLLVQMAKAKGAFVIGTCSTKEKADIATRRGCDYVIITKSSDDENNDNDEIWDQIPEMVQEIIQQHLKDTNDSIIPSNYGNININDGAHVAYDSVGKSSAMASLQCLRPRGLAVFFGNASGAPPDINPLLLSKLGSLSMTRPKLHDFIQTRDEVVKRSSEVFQMVRDGHLDINIQEIFDFTRQGVIEGTQMLQGRKTVGKVLFDIKNGVAIHRKYRSAAREIQAPRRTSSLENKIDNINSDHSPQTIDEAYNIGYW